MDSKPYSVHTIVTHTNPHFDELVGIWLLTRFGKEMFPGIEKSERIFIDAGSETFNGMTADQALEQGYLLLGVGGGVLDEHPSEKTGRVHNECAATLVAKQLGMDSDLSLQRILKYVKTRDLQGNDEAGLFGLANCLDTATRNGVQPKVIEMMTVMLLGARYNEEREFCVKAAQDFEKVSTTQPYLPNRPSLVVAWIESDNRRIHSYGFHTANVGVFVVQRSTSHIQVFPNHKLNLNMDGVVAEIRKAEAQTIGKTINPDHLCREGKVEGAKAWHYQAATGIVMNGSHSAQNVLPTQLDLQTVVECVIKGLRQEEARVLATR